MPLTLRTLLHQKDAQTVLADLALSRTPCLDLIAELSRQISGHDAAAVVLYDENWITPLGQANCSFERFRRVIHDRVLNESYSYIPDVPKRFPNSSLVNGEVLKAESLGLFRLQIQQETIGGIGIYNFTPHQGPSADQVAAIRNLAHVAEELIRSKAEMKIALTRVFSMAER